MFSRTSLVPLQAVSLRSQALYLVIECFHFLGASRVLGFRRIGGAHLFQRFLDGEFGCFGHGEPHIQPDAFGSFNLARALSTDRTDVTA
jgi:hypothetical protein